MRLGRTLSISDKERNTTPSLVPEPSRVNPDEAKVRRVVLVASSAGSHLLSRCVSHQFRPSYFEANLKNAISSVALRAWLKMRSVR